MEGSLTELTGAGSCLSQNQSATGDCTPLAGLPQTGEAGGDIGAPAFSADGRNAYLGTQRPARDFDEGPGILYALSRDPASGRLTQLTGAGSCLAEEDIAPCQVARGFGAFSRTAVTKDGRFVYVHSVAGVAVFRRDSSTGRLTQLSGRNGCYTRLSQAGCTRVRGMYSGTMRLTPGDRQVLINSGPTIYILRRDSRTGALRWPGKKTGCMSFSSRSRCRRIPEIAELPQYTRRGTTAYAPSDDVDGVVVFRNDPSTGALTAVGDPVCARRTTRQASRRCPFPSGGSQVLTLSPDERNLYMSDTVLDELVAFAVDRPRQVRAIAGGFGCRRGVTGGICEGEAIGWQLELTPDGRFGYQIVGGLVLAYSRDRATGQLSRLSGADGCLSDSDKPGCTPFQNLRDPWRARISPDGRQLYVSSVASPRPPGNTLVVLARNEAAAGRRR